MMQSPVTRTTLFRQYIASSDVPVGEAVSPFPMTARPEPSSVVQNVLWTRKTLDRGSEPPECLKIPLDMPGSLMANLPTPWRPIRQARSRNIRIGPQSDGPSEHQDMTSSQRLS